MSRFLFKRWKHLSVSCLHLNKQYSTGGTSAALRPFYLLVHPDLLWQHPSKKEVNENSLKQLNHFLDCLQKDTNPDGPHSLPFYLRKSSKDEDHPLVNVVLDRSSLNGTIRSILTSCDISVASKEGTQPLFTLDVEEESLRNQPPFYRKLRTLNEMNYKNKIAKVNNVDLVRFLSDRSQKSHERLRGITYARSVTTALTQEMKDVLKLKDVVWRNQWTILQHRNCIEDLVRLSKQYQTHMDYLTGRTLVFGDETGFHLSGDLVFECRGSRRHWIDLLEKVPESYQQMISIRKAEAKIMDQLQGRIVYRHCKPLMDLGKHLHWLQKLSSNLDPHLSEFTMPFLSSGEPLRIIIDSTASEMKLLESGEIVVCPNLLGKDILAFLARNSEEAVQKVTSYRNAQTRELELQERCAKALGVGSFFKDENVSPESMIKCCTRLAYNHNNLRKMFQNLHICVSEYYVLIEDGTLCIPWNWISNKFMD